MIFEMTGGGCPAKTRKILQNVASYVGFCPAKNWQVCCTSQRCSRGVDNFSEVGGLAV